MLQMKQEQKDCRWCYKYVKPRRNLRVENATSGTDAILSYPLSQL